MDEDGSMQMVNRLLVALICTVWTGSANAGLNTIEGQGSGNFDVPNSLEFTALVEGVVSDTDPNANSGFYAGAVTAFDFVLLANGFSPIGATGLTGDVTATRNLFGIDIIRLPT